jgi:NADPH:quinone reductase-like Zn-dependent oxidoreductase
LTIGSALDIFGGSLSFDDVIEFSAPPPTSMSAVEIDSSQNGTPDALVLVQRPLPVIKPGELLIKVSASGVNRPDVLQRSGNDCFTSCLKQSQDLPTLYSFRQVPSSAGCF